MGPRWRSPKTVWWLFALLLGSADLFGAEQIDAKESHSRMVQTLSQLAERSERENPYLGKGELALRQQAVQASASFASAERRAQPLVQLGLVELRLGMVRETVRHLEAAWQLLPDFPEASRKAAEKSLAYHLGLAYLRMGEIDNCVALHGSESCLLPIGPGGRHQVQEGSRKSIQYFQSVLKSSEPDSSEYLASMWLMNIAFMTLGGYPDDVPQDTLIPPKTFEDGADFPRFRNLAPAMGLDTLSLSGGAAVEDFNGDGLLDIVASTWDTRGPLRYFENAGDGTFSERTSQAGLEGIWGGLNLEQADYDNDGDVDILVLRGAWLLGEEGRHPNSLLQNQGNGTFLDVTFAAGLGEVHYPTQTAAWADYDNDGDLDLYVGNEALPRQPFPSQLFRNNGDGTFTDAARRAGVENLRYAKAVTWGDYNSDGFADLYVSNLGMANRLYRNNGDGTFEDVAVELNLLEPLDSFTSWFWDYDNDGRLDLFVSAYSQYVVPDRLAAVVASQLGRPGRGERHRLYRGLEGGRFEDVTEKAGLTKVALVMGANFGDLDNDGFPDFYLGTGYPFYDGLTPNLMYWNRQGRAFADVTFTGGFGHLQKGHAVVFADLDSDGDQDVFEEMGGAYPGDAFANALYENPGFGHHWLKIRLQGVRSNRSAVGARLRVDIREGGTQRSVYHLVNTGGSFGANPFLAHIGLGKAERIERLEISWPGNGVVQTIPQPPMDATIRVVEGKSGYTRIDDKPRPFRPSKKSPMHHAGVEN